MAIRIDGNPTSRELVFQADGGMSGVLSVPVSSDAVQEALKGWAEQTITPALVDMIALWPSPVAVELDAPTPLTQVLLREIQIIEAEFKIAILRNNETAIRQLKGELSAHPDGGDTRVLSVERLAKDADQQLNALYSAAVKYGRASDVVTTKRAHLLHKHSELSVAAEKQIRSGDAKRVRLLAEQDKRRRGDSLSTVQKSEHSHRFADQMPSESWTLLIDETGNVFDATQRQANGRGRVVGILVPAHEKLPDPQRDAHGTTDSAEDVDSRVQAVLDAPVGVFGVGIDDLPPTLGERWVSGVLEVIEWAVRLIPLLEEGITTVQAVVEQRGEFAPKLNWAAVAHTVMRQLAIRDPERAARVQLFIRVAAKNDEPFLAYADAIAFTWGGRGETERARLRQSGLVGSCLMEQSSESLRRAWDLLRQGTLVPGEDWRRLVSSPDAANEASVAALMLKRIGDRCQKDLSRWTEYLTASARYLGSKALDLRAVGREMVWLQEYRPVEGLLRTDLMLAFAIARLEMAAHRGQIDAGAEVEVETFSDRLFDEDPALVCQADLVRAVLATNRFDFAEASRRLSRWNQTPPALAGLQHWARVQSSLGQHAAFTGKTAEALQYFQLARDAFRRLSNSAESARELSQTGAYVAIAMMDDPSQTTEAIRHAVSEVVSLSMNDIAAISGDVSPARQYPHHVLLRYLVMHGTPEEKTTYLSAREEWENNPWHPWPLITAYRAILIQDTDPEAARDLFLQARELTRATDQGPVVRLIGEAISVAGLRGEPLSETQTSLDSLEKVLPQATPRIRYLKACVNDRRSTAFEVLAGALPFNFR